MAFFKSGKIRTDTYYQIKDNSHQAIYSYQTKPTATALGNVSFAIGTDYKLDDGATFDRTVIDGYISKPIIDGLAFNGRIRTNYSDDKSSTQFRGGLELSHSISDRTKAYAQVYGAEKICYNKGQSAFAFGAFGGFSHKLSDNSKFYVETQCYDLENPKKDNWGFNIGYSYEF